MPASMSLSCRMPPNGGRKVSYAYGVRAPPAQKAVAPMMRRQTSMILQEEMMQYSQHRFEL